MAAVTLKKTCGCGDFEKRVAAVKSLFLKNEWPIMVDNLCARFAREAMRPVTRPDISANEVSHNLSLIVYI